MANLTPPPLTPSPLPPSPCLSHSPRCAWLLLFDLCPRLQVGGAGVQSWPITIRASPSVTRPLWGWIMSRLPTADSPVSGNLSNMDRWELRTGHENERCKGWGGEERYRTGGKVRKMRGLTEKECMSQKKKANMSEILSDILACFANMLMQMKARKKQVKLIQCYIYSQLVNREGLL